MEERLFFIGVGMGLYTWLTRRWMKSGELDTRMATTLWHALFCALAGFGVAMVAVMSIETRSRFSTFTVGVVSPREFYTSLTGAIIAGAWGTVNAWQRARSAAGRKHYHLEDLEWAETVCSAVLLAATMMYFVVQAFKIPSGSMRNTLIEGDHLFVNKFIYGIRIPFTHTRVLGLRPVQRGDIVVFRFPTDDPGAEHCGGPQYGKDFIKRVVGVPGDEIKMVDGELYVNGKKAAPEPYAVYDWPYPRFPAPTFPWKPEQYQRSWQSGELDQRMQELFGYQSQDIIRDQFGPVTVPAGAVFAMGDNRDHSCDSRFWGPVADYYLKGKAWLLYWPPARMGFVR